MLHSRLREGIELWAGIPVHMAPYFQFSWLLVSYMYAGKGGFLGVPAQTILTNPTRFIFYLGVHYVGLMPPVILFIPWSSTYKMPRAGITSRAAAGCLATDRSTVAGHSRSLLVDVLDGVRRAFTEGRPSYSPGNLLHLTRPSLAMRVMASLSVRLGTAPANACRWCSARRGQQWAWRSLLCCEVPAHL